MCIRIDRKLKSSDIIDVLPDHFALHGVSGDIHLDNGSNITKVVRQSITAVAARTAFVELGSPRDNGYYERLGFKRRDEFLNGQIFYSLAEALIIQIRHQHYISCRCHFSLDHRTPASAAVPWPTAPAQLASSAISNIADKPNHVLDSYRAT